MTCSVTPVRPTRVEAALLYEAHEPFSYEELANELKDLFEEEVQVNLGAHHDGIWGVLTIGGHVVKISQNGGPLAPKGFQGALASPANKLMVPDAEEIIAGHQKNVFITVGGDEILMPDIEPGTFSEAFEELLADAIKREGVPSLKHFSNRVFIARLVVCQVMALARPKLVHWCQSDQLLRPEWMDLARDPRGMCLQIHPSFNLGTDITSGQPGVGFHAFGAEHICGYHMIFNPFAGSTTAAVEAAEDLAYHLLTKRSQVPERAEMTLKSGARLQVSLHANLHKHPRPYISVNVIKPAPLRGIREFALENTAPAKLEAPVRVPERPAESRGRSVLNHMSVKQMEASENMASNADSNMDQNTVPNTSPNSEAPFGSMLMSLSQSMSTNAAPIAGTLAFCAVLYTITNF